MYQDVVIAGFGGQGILMIGNLLSIAGIYEGRKVTYFPVYGVEMRGGTANCTVIISDEEIGSPVIGNPMALIAMNGPSLAKYIDKVKPDATVVVNSSLCDNRQENRNDVALYLLPANDIAEKIGTQQLASMVALGAFVQISGVVRVDTLIDCLPRVISKRYEKLIPLNVEAILEGGRVVKERQG
ncbi:MAG: 2-oxoacid:ferredoxin oxidoreductase subunit gamma [Deltaproteobacteria bacterium]|nr:2-oxoacid:ferredoxin oxidoreductase subunit gamma [Deltaproteobacteria bacterium]